MFEQTSRKNGYPFFVFIVTLSVWATVCKTVGHSVRIRTLCPTVFEITPCFRKRLVNGVSEMQNTNVLLPPPRRICIIIGVCLSVFCVAVSNFAQKTFEGICMKFLRKIGNGPVNKRLNFCGDPNHESGSRQS